jgi:hypothetical protein
MAANINALVAKLIFADLSLAVWHHGPAHNAHDADH